MLLKRFEGHARSLFALVERYNLYLFGALFMVGTTGVALIVLNAMPHISDEIAYQFQARAMAQGKLYFDSLSLKEFFIYGHAIMDQDKWYGIMHPGWPALLAFGYLARLPWIINPILGLLTLWCFYAFLKRAGYTSAESRLAVLLLGISPFMVFLSASYLSHAANLLGFALFCLAWLRMEATGRWKFAVVAGVALGFNILIRPIDSIAA